jgi:ribosome biogenesis GTPase A
MVIGIPNTGKSTLINRYAGRGAAKTEDRPGVTRNRQWIKVKKDFELLDTPGILWGKFDDPRTGLYIALTGGITDRVIDVYTLAVSLIEILTERYPDYIPKRYGVETRGNAEETLAATGERRGFLLRGGEIDTERAAVMLIDEFRAGKLGRVTLDRIHD